MTRTNTFFEQDTPNTDGQFFVGASEFIDTSGFATTASAGQGLFTKNVPATDAATFFANVSAILRRTGQYATPSRVQEQFGTAASVPGPTVVIGTGSPDGVVGYPPTLAAQMATLTGGQSGPIPKGFEITSIDVIYEVDTTNATVATCSLTVTSFANGVAPAVTSRIALANNGLSLVNANGLPYVINVPVPNPVFSTANDGETILNVNFTPGAGGTVKFYGAVLRCNFNLN